MESPTNPTTEEIAAELRAEASRQKLKYPQIAEKTSYSFRTINRCMAGDTPITYALFAEVSAALGRRPSQIIEAAEAQHKISA